jgi:anti-sigma regulatory factor (Ser/Thr protein kinase)
MIPIAARDTAAVGALRGVARSALTWWKVPVQTRADVLITLSELATNALVHTDGPLRVRLTYRSGTVRLDVADSSHVHAQARTPDLNADTPGGWGLTIAEALADRLTVTDDNTGPGKITTVEFRIKQ